MCCDILIVFEKHRKGNATISLYTDVHRTIWLHTYFLISYMFLFDINNSSASSSVWTASKAIIKLPWKQRPPAKKTNHTVFAQQKKTPRQRKKKYNRKMRNRVTAYLQSTIMIILECAYLFHETRLTHSMEFFFLGVERDVVRG